MKNFVAAAAAVAFIVGSPARAADMPVKAPALVPVVQTWVGTYVGVNGGWGIEDPTAYVNAAGLLPLFPGGPLINNALTTPPFSMSLHAKGWLGGVQIGHNWQTANFVYGVEADFNFAGIKGSVSGPYQIGVFPVDTVIVQGIATLSQRIDYFGTARLRGGILVTPNMLAYLTGGLAWEHARTTLSSASACVQACSSFPGFNYGSLDGTASTSRFAFGYAVGAGGEWAIDRIWSIKGEYLFIGGIGGGGSNTLVIPVATADDRTGQLHIFRLGLNYKFSP